MRRILIAFCLLFLTSPIQAMPFGPERTLPGSAPSANDAQVVWNGEVFGVAWLQADGVWFGRITAYGALLQTIRIFDGHPGDVALAASATQFLVAWSDKPADQPWTIRGARISRDGSLLDTVPMTLSFVPTLQLSARQVAAASDGGEFAVLSTVTRSGIALPYEIVATLVSSAGVPMVLDQVIHRSASPLQHPEVAFAGPDYLVAWTGYSDLGSTDPCIWAGFPPPYAYQASNVYAARLARSGLPIDSAPTRISLDTTNHGFPSIVVRSDEIQFAWSRGLCVTEPEIREVTLPREDIGSVLSLEPSAGTLVGSAPGLAGFAASAAQDGIVYGWWVFPTSQIVLVREGDSTPAILESDSRSFRFFDFAARDASHGIVVHGTSSGVAYRTFGEQGRRRGGVPHLSGNAPKTSRTH